MSERQPGTGRPVLCGGHPSTQGYHQGGKKMRTRGKRCLSWLLVLTMCLSLLPAAAFAADTRTFTAIADFDQLDTGTYVIVASNGYALGGIADGNNWLKATSVTPANGVVAIPEETADYILTVTKKSATTATIQNADGKYVACNGTANTAFVQDDEYIWTLDSVAEHGILIRQTADQVTADTYYLNSAGSTANKFRAYKKSTCLNDDGTAKTNYYPYFTFYKESTGPVTKVSTPRATPAAGAVPSGTEVALSCSTAGADIYYTTDSSVPTKDSGTKYTAPISITADTTIKAVAVDPNAALEDSSVLEAAYTVLTDSDISAVRAGGTDKVVQVSGTVIAKYANATSSALGCYIQDGTGGIMLYDNTKLGDYEVGDQLTAVGTTAEYNGKFELTKIASVNKTGNTALTPAAFDVTKLGTPAEVEAKEGMLVTLEGLIVTGETTDNYKTCSLTLQSGDNSLTAKLDNRRPDFTAGALEEKVAPGNIVTITGYFESTNKDNMQHIFHLRSVDDVTVTGNVDKVLAPTASPAGGSSVGRGTVITFSSTTADATIQYKVGDAGWATGNSYTVPADAAFDSTITIQVKATHTTLPESDTATFTYTVKDTPVGKWTKVTDTLADGAQLVLVHKGEAKAMTDTATSDGKKLTGTDAAVKGEFLQIAQGMSVLTAAKDTDGHYTFKNLDGKYLTSGEAGGSLTFVDTATGYSLWDIEPVNGGVQIHSVNAAYSGNKNQYLEYYSGFTTYGIGNGGAAYLFNLYAVTDETPVFPVETPVITPEASSTDQTSLEITITCATDGASIHYTTDGTEPTAASTAYTAPFNVTLTNGKATVKAIAVKDGMENSAVAVKDYFYFNPSADFTPVTSVEQVKEGGYFVLIPKNFPDRAMSTSFAYKPTAVNVTLAAGTYAPTLKFAPMDDGVSIQYEATQKYISYAGSGTDFAEAAAPFKFTVTANKDGTFRIIPNNASNRAISYRGSGDTGVFAPYTVTNDGKTDDYGTYECDMLILRSVKGYLYNPQINFGTLNDAIPGQDYVTTYTLAETDVVSGVVAQYSLDNTTWAGAAVDTAAQTVTVPGSAIPQGTEKLYLKITATDTRGETEKSLEKTAEVAVTNEPVIYTVSPANGVETGSDLKPDIVVNVLNGGAFTAKLTLKPKTGAAITGVDMTVDTAKGTATYTPAAELAEGWCEASVTVTRDDGKTVSKDWSFTVGVAKYQNYFGQLHSHTAEYSDGAGTLDEALSYIKDTAYRNNVQFAAFTDHSNYFDGKTGPKNADGSDGAAAPEAALYDASLLTEAQQQNWQTYRDKVARFNSENAGSMVALAGFEMTWSGGPGHINTFNTPGIVSRNNSTLNNKTNDAGMRAYYTLLSNDKGADSISQFNHPGTTFGTFSEFAYYDPTIDSRITLVEVGNGEGAIRSGGYFPSYSEYIKALDKGWHLAPTNNQDNHKGHWGDANDARTVVYTSDLSERGIYQAMREMSLYATEDKNLDITYTVNGYKLGTILAEVPSSVTFKASISDPDGENLAAVEIVTNGGAVLHKVENINADSYELDYTLTAPKAGYYFLRVTQADKDIAVTAPVWLGKAKNVGMSELSTTTFMAVQGEAVTFTNQFFNNESTSATVKSMTYTVNGEQVSASTPEQAIRAMGTWDNTFTYTFPASGTMTLELTAVVEAGGETKTLKSTLAVDVKDPDALVYIGVDGSHHNEYVSGNYKDSMGNFGSLAAGFDARVNVLNTSAELLAALENPKYKMMVFTAPTRRLTLTDTWTSYDVYSDAELAAIAAFAQRGGAIVVAGWGDYYESYAYCPKEPGMQMSAQQNNLLAAIGSSLRVADDEAKDNVNKPGSNAARLYLDDYNGMKSPLLAGVDPSQVWSQYGGCSIYAVDGQGAPTDTLPASVTPIISGYGKFESDGSGIDLDKIDSSDDDGDGYMNGVDDKTRKPPKYQSDKGLTCLLTASETLTHANGTQSLVVVSGGAFMSNFEIKFDADNATQLGYSNPVLLGNLVESLNPPVITDIATVQAEGQQDEAFTVEGYITANTSGFDRDTAFFDCTYVQDETGGINIFPVSDSFQAGQRVRVSGTITYYQGEKELTVKSIKLLDRTPATVTPVKVTTAQAASGAYLGQLIEVEGTVTSVEQVNGAIQTIRVKDDSGTEARIFIDGYITASKDPALQQVAKTGAAIKAVGIASYDNTFNEDGSESNRIRIRDRADITASDWTSSSGGTDSTAPSKPSNTAPVVKPSDVVETEAGAEVSLPAAGAKFSEAAKEKLTELNETKPVTLKGSGLKVILPAGTLEKGVDPADLLVDPAGKGNAVQVTYPDGTTEIVPFALVSDDGATYVASKAGAYALVDNTKHFSDVEDGFWGASAVEFASANELFNGVGDGRFAPDGTMTRAMLVTVLARLGGIAVDNSTASFPDVPAGTWYSGAVAWAAETGIVTGSEGNFDPDGLLTREALCTILARFLEKTGITLDEVSDGSGFTDMDSVSGWAKDGVVMALKTGLLNGKPGKLIDPTGQITRAEVAAVLQRFVAAVLD